MKKVLMSVLAVLFFAGISFAAALQAPEEFSTKVSGKTIKEVAKAIEDGAKRRSWQVEKNKDNSYTLTLFNRQHEIVVLAKYSATGWTIIYKDSKNMKYDARKNLIHPNYNRWVQSLDNTIRNYANQ